MTGRRNYSANGKTCNCSGSVRVIIRIIFMNTAIRFGLISAAVMTLSPVGAQVPDLSGVSIMTTPLGAGVYMLEASGDVAGNIAVSVGEDGVLIVDDQWQGLTGQILETLQDLHAGPLRFILNTHHHDDHSDGNAALRAATGATVIAHEQVRARLMHKQAAHWPTVTYATGLTIHFNGETIQTLAVPGGLAGNLDTGQLDASGVRPVVGQQHHVDCRFCRGGCCRGADIRVPGERAAARFDHLESCIMDSLYTPSGTTGRFSLWGTSSDRPLGNRRHLDGLDLEPLVVRLTL